MTSRSTNGRQENDDAAERAARRKASGADVAKENAAQRVASKPVAAPSPKKVLDNRELADLYSTCINMSTQNVRRAHTGAGCARERA